MPKYLLAHDIGTSGDKATLFTTEGVLVKSKIYSYETNFFRDNWAEQNPHDWWTAVCRTTKEILEGIQKEDIVAVSFSGQMMGCLCVDKEGNPLRPAIIWADMRSVKETAFIGERITPKRFYRVTGHRLSPSYGVEKLLWVKNNEPEIYENTYKMFNAKDYIVFKLTGEFLTDFSDASGTCMLDINTTAWSDEILSAAGIDGDKLPDLKESTYRAGGVTPEAAEQTGLAAGTSVICGGGDGLCAAVGAGCIKEGVAYNYVGSSSWIAITTPKPIFDENMRTFNWVHIVPGYVSPCGTMQCAGGSYNWLKNEICKSETLQAEQQGVSPYELINTEIESSPVGAKGLIFLPYLVGERSPHWNPNAKGAFIGLKMEHKREDILRSVLEGVTLNLNVILSEFKQNAHIEKMIVIGGGAKGKVWRQIMADIYNVQILKPNYLEEATSMGAAVTGGVGAGVFKDFNVIDNFIEIESIDYPIEKNTQKYNKLVPLFAESYASLEHIFERLSNV